MQHRYAQFTTEQFQYKKKQNKEQRTDEEKSKKKKLHIKQELRNSERYKEKKRIINDSHMGDTRRDIETTL